MKKFLLIAAITIFAAGVISAQAIKVERAVINYKITSNETGFMQSGTMEIAYDKFGKFMASTTETPGMKATTIITPDSEYMIDWNEKIAIDLKAFGGAFGEAFGGDGIPGMDDEDDPGREIGRETILGKPCTIYYSEDEYGTEKVWLWQGLALKVITESEGVKTTMEATSVSTPASIPASKFQVPRGIEIQQIPSFSFPMPGMSY